MNGKTHVLFFCGPSKLVNLHLSASIGEQFAKTAPKMMMMKKLRDILFCLHCQKRHVENQPITVHSVPVVVDTKTGFSFK